MGSAPDGASRYEVLFKLAAGGMATVYVGTARGAMGFRQIVAIKRPHPHLLDDPGYRRELVAEARLASLIHHVNVVDVRDVEATDTTLQLVMDYIEGASFGELIVAASKAGRRLPPGAVVRIALDACAGLHAAHELIDEKGRAVGLVHRDISPQNILVGLDGTARVSDFGVAKATAASATTSGALKGKLAYMAPEYLQGQRIDRRADVFAMGVVVWEALTGKRLFRGASEADTIHRVLFVDPKPVSAEAPELGTHFDAALATALAKKPEERFATARAFAAALEASAQGAGTLASHPDVAAVVLDLAGVALEARRAEIRGRLSQEPGLLSIMGADPPSLPTRDLGAATVPDARPVQLPPLALYGSTEPTVSEVSAATQEPLSPAGVPPARSALRRVAGVAAVVGVLAGGAGLLAMRAASRPPERAAPASDVSIAPPVRSQAASAAPVPSSELDAAPPPLAPLSSTAAPPAAHAPAAHHVKPPSGPPPNPYR